MRAVNPGLVAWTVHLPAKHITEGYGRLSARSRAVVTGVFFLDLRGTGHDAEDPREGKEVVSDSSVLSSLGVTGY